MLRLLQLSKNPIIGLVFKCLLSAKAPKLSLIGNEFPRNCHYRYLRTLTSRTRIAVVWPEVVLGNTDLEFTQ